jgi:hypothetical protein
VTVVADTIYERGDVVFGVDPFKPDGTGRPWVIVSNHEGRLFHGEQYIALTLTTRTWLDGLVAVPESAWSRGGTPDDSRIVPWGVQSLGSADIERWQGRLGESVVDDAVEKLVQEVQ